MPVTVFITYDLAAGMTKEQYWASIRVFYGTKIDS